MTRAWTSNAFRVGIVGTILAVLIGSVVFSTFSVVSQINTLRRATSDNIPWNLSQVEVEYLQFELSLDEILHHEENMTLDSAPANLAILRRQFDIFYSRMQTIAESPLYRRVRADSDSAQAFGVIRQFLEEQVPLIDSTDPVLLAALPDMARATEAIGPSVRDLSLSGVAVSTVHAEGERAQVMTTLYRLGMTTALLFFVLVGLTVMIWRASGRLRRSVREKDVTAARLSTVISTSPDPIVVTDRNMHVIEFNRAAETAFGYSREEAMGGVVAELIVPKELRAQHLAGVERYLATGQPSLIGRSRVRAKALRKDGVEFPAEISLSTGTGPEGQIFVSYIRDITEDIEKEREIYQARDVALAGEKAKERLLNTMSHEMRTPLHGILGAHELLRETDLTSAQQKFARIAENAATTLLHHVDNVLHVASDTSRHLRIENHPFDLLDLVSEVINEEQILAAKNGNTLELASFPPAIRRIESDKIRLRRVLVNLLSNAVKFTKDGRITLDVLSLPGSKELEFRVADTGIGITPDEQEKIFDDFYTNDASFSRRHTGTGLGLGITRRIIDAMGGSIGVQSTPGKGSTFWFRIPVRSLVDSPAAHSLPGETVAPGAAAQGLGVRDILVVEDNEINRLVLHDALAASQFRVTMAESGQEGVDLAASRRFDCILMDISMPGMSGVEATGHIRAGDGASRDVPIIAVTANVLPEDRERYLEAGMNRVLSKPYSVKQLIAEIASVLSDSEGDEPAPGLDVANLVDLSQFEELSDTVGAKRAGDLLQEFFEDFSGSLAELEHAGREGNIDADRMTRELHRLAGSASVFGATALLEQLRALETETKSHGIAPGLSALPTLKELLERTRDVLLPIAVDAD